MPNIIVTSNVQHWPKEIQGVPVIAAKEYVSNPEYSKKRYRVFNLCISYKYQGNGYYVSLLAEARRHTVLPSVKTITDMQSAFINRISTSEIVQLWQSLLEPLRTDDFTLSIYFGRNMAGKYERLATALFNLFPVPLLRAEFFRSDGKWHMKSINPIPLKDVPEDHFSSLLDFAKLYFRTSYKLPTGRKTKYDMAILVNPEEKEPPSDKKALERFAKVANQVGFSVEYIGRQDISRLPQFDALFIRETTSVNHHTFRFAKRAELEGISVLDDPTSIIRCSNKVYLAELLNLNKIAAPKTVIISKDNLNDSIQSVTFPCILKQPDSSFSQGVLKANNEKEFLETGKTLLQKSDLILAQEFMPTEFDWRVGLVDGEPIFACRYYMASSHWQVMNWGIEGRSRYGKVETFRLDEVPEGIIMAAKNVAALIGCGFYGVDLKWHNHKAHIIEVNDNPNLDAGTEDKIDGKMVYQKIAEYFLKRLEKGNEKK